MKIRRKRTEPVKETQMVSLADIAFLIIFFFLLSSTFMRDKIAVDLPKLPRSSKTESVISVTLDDQSKIFLDGEEVSTPDGLESRLKDKLAGRTKPQDCEVRFKCPKTQKYKKFRPIYEAIANAGGIISIMHEIR